MPGRGMSSQASSHGPNRSSGNKTSEDEEAKSLRMLTRMQYKEANSGGHSKAFLHESVTQIVQATSQSVACTSSSSLSRAVVAYVVMQRWWYI